MLKARQLAAVALAGLLLGALAWVQRPSSSPAQTVSARRDSAFAARIAELSEPGGYFDTDNLISNERSYLQVIPDLRRAKFSGGAYVGVGPDQNFTYIAAVRPSIAFIVDIRRDNLLLHLLFKALFELSRTRVEYLALLLGRPAPSELEDWRDAPIEQIAEYMESAAPDPAAAKQRRRIDAAIASFGVRLTPEDFATIDRFHDRFVGSALELRFHSTGRQPQSHYPTYGELLRQRAPDGTFANFMATEDAFQTIRRLQTRDLIIPVVGNLSGPSALAAIGRTIAQRGEHLNAFYASNVEFYLFADGRFGEYAANLRRLPHDERSVIIRSVFGRYSNFGGGSSSHTQRVAEMLEAVRTGRVRSYRDLVGGR